MFNLRKAISLPLITLIVLSSFVRFTVPAHAEEFVITGNGDGSESTVTVAATTQTTVTQTNNADVQNDVNQNANTGNNTASNNTGGEIGITTGDANLNSSIENAFNNSQVDSSVCCTESGTTITISGNGSGSTNNVDLGISQGNYTKVYQNAYVSNYVNGYGTTGRNGADNNTVAWVSITTGDIIASGKIKNGPINTSAVVSGNPMLQLSAVILNNGTGSTNNINAAFDNPQIVVVNNNFEVTNRTIWHLITGENHASGNTGGTVNIMTGDVFLNLWLENVANSSTVTIDCCHTVTPPPPPPSCTDDPGCVTPPPTTTSSGGGGGGGGGGRSSSGSPVLGLSFTGAERESGMIAFAGFLMIAAGISILTKKHGKNQNLFSFV